LGESDVEGCQGCEVFGLFVCEIELEDFAVVVYFSDGLVGKRYKERREIYIRK
jgi:hypothetical protein